MLGCRGHTQDRLTPQAAFEALVERTLLLNRMSNSQQESRLLRD
jgi:hypothetical protein